ncbi:MAG TPA: hypothetical protein ENK98_01595 [Epsilonproteobacteria bacterium]|nr:hypothetical protein [Campylobacterota bacterium]
MKHTDCLTTLKSLKKHYLKTQRKKSHFPIYEATENVVCTCTDSNGNPKYLYTSQKEIEYILSSKSINLKSYPCPYEKGWHLTKG